METSINGKFKLTLHKKDDLPVIVQVRDSFRQWWVVGWKAGGLHLLPAS